MAKKIVELEAADAEKIKKQNLEEKALEDKMRSELMDKDKVQQEFYKLTRQKEQMLAEYSMRLEEIQGSLNVFEKKHFDLQQATIGMKSERDEIKNKLFRESIRYKNCADQMARLDKEIEDVLGRAVSNNDLETLYKLDLKDLNEINKDGSNS